MTIPESAPLGHILRRLRLRAALSQDGLADRSGVSARTISDLERGQRASARFDTIRMLADALELPADDRKLLVQAAQAPLIDITLQQPNPAPSSLRGLPAPKTKLIGRDREIHDIERELASGEHRLITLTGPGGVGKTRVALAAASRAAGHFPGGLTWFDLSTHVDARAIIGAISDGLGIVESGDQSRLDALCRWFAGRRFLLILDNFEHVIDAAPAVSELLAAAPDLTVLVTSRAPLNVLAEIEHPVAPLELPALDGETRAIGAAESVQLFVERARAAQRDFTLTPENSVAVAQICRKLDGLPLALELAASRIRVLTPRMLVERLDHPLPLLTRGSRDAPRRQQTMSDTIAWSYNLLDPGVQWLFRQLSVFVGGFTLDTIEWITASLGRNRDEAIDALTTLTDNNLVARAHGAPHDARFTMYESIREFGMAQLAERQELREAHYLLAAYCRSLARFGDGIPTCIVPEPWIVMLDAERANIRAAHQFLAGSHDPASLFDFTTAFGHYLYNRGPVHEAWSWFERILDTPVAVPASLRLQALYWAGHLTAHLGKAEQSIRFANEALGIAEEIGDPTWRAAVIHCLGVVHEACGRFDEATELLEEALGLWEEAGVQGLSGFEYMLLGSIAFLRGDVPMARSMEDKAEPIFCEMGGLGWVALTKWLRGLFSCSEGRLHDAAASFSESLQLSHQQRAALIYHKPLFGLAFVASQLALHETAGRLIGAAEKSVERAGIGTRGYDQRLYDLVVSTSRSAVGTVAFDEARVHGGAADHADLVGSGEMIKRTAAVRPLKLGGDQRFAAFDSVLPLQRNSAAD